MRSRSSPLGLAGGDVLLGAFYAIRHRVAQLVLEGRCHALEHAATPITAPLPEPAIYALLLVGLGLVGQE